MKNGASIFANIKADVIAIEELNPIYAPTIQAILQNKTGAQWDYRVSAQGINGQGSGMGEYWRTDRVELVADLGSVSIDTLPSNYDLRFRGVILRIKGTNRQFGFFSGKLVWVHGGDDADRRAEAVRVKTWVNQQMANYPAASARIIAADFNDTVGSPAYNVFGAYDDGGARKPTAPAADPQRRIDYLLWADSNAGASRHGFVTAHSDDRLGRSSYYGSDHRFVFGDALIP
jgi:hypothetical protein